MNTKFWSHVPTKHVHLYLFETTLGWKYVHRRKNNEIINKNIFHLMINIVHNSDHLHFMF